MTRPLDISFTNEGNDAFVDFELSNPYIPESIASGFENISKVKYGLLNGWQCKYAEYLASKPCFFEWQRFNCSIGFPKDRVSGELELLINSVPHKTQAKERGDFLFINTNFKFENAVGYTTFEVRDSHNTQTPLFRFDTEVFPQKLDYKEDYEQMMEDVTSIIYNLAFDYLKQTHSLGVPKDSYNKSLNEFIAILKVIYDRLELSVDQILRNPKSKIEQTGRVREVSQVKRIMKRPDKWIRQNRKHLSKTPRPNSIELDSNIHITHLPEQKKRVSYDTFENQFVLWAIKDVISKIDEVIKFIEASRYRGSKGNESAIEELNTFKRRLRFRMNDGYFANVSKFDLNFHFSTTLTMAPGYKDFYKRYLLLKKGLSISENEIFKIDLKDIATLYEYWCFLKIIDTLKNNKKYDFESSDLLKIEHQKFVVKLKKGANSNIHLKKRGTGERISIGYNREFAGPTDTGDGISSTFKQIPDNFIEFSKEGYDAVGPIKKPFKYVLDAKYRFDKSKEDDSKNESDKFGPPQDAIGQLHRYRDAMLWKTQQEGNYQRAIKNLGGAILFPYPLDEYSFKGSKYDKSLSTVNIGAIPLRPGSDNVLFQTFLDRLFESSGDELMESVIEFDKEPLRLFERNVRIPILIGMIRENSNKARLEFLNKYNLFYVHKSTNPRLFDVKKILLYNQKTGKLIGQYKVENTFFDSKYSYPLINPTQEDYLFFKVKKELDLDITFNLEGLGNKYFFTNNFAAEMFEKSGDKSFLKLNRESQFRMVRKLQAKMSRFEVKRVGDFQIDESNRDVSDVKIKLEVCCGVVYNEQGDVLIARKAKGKSNEGLWEFPGGKQLKSESETECVQREFLEELGMNVVPNDKLGEVEVDEGPFVIYLKAYKCSYTNASFQLIDHDKYEWVNPSNLIKYPVSKSDKALIERSKL